MKIRYWLACSLVAMDLATRSQGQPASNTITDPSSLDTPTNTSLVLSNVSGELRVLDAQGLVLETNFNYLPRIKLADLSTDELHALLNTKVAYATLTTFPSFYGTNGQAAVLESQLRQIWLQGNSIADKIQTRLEILEDLREYNVTLALLPGSMAAADQYEIHAEAVNDRVASWQEPERPEYGFGNREGRHEAWEHWERANVRAMAANGQAVGSEQQVEGYLAKCATLSARLATHGVLVSADPPFTFIPPLTMKAEVNQERR
jgi:hypothetical protein